MSHYEYEGAELELFARAMNWKSYWSSLLKPYVRGHVLEVGAGNGNNLFLLESLDYVAWTSVEPDRNLAATLARKTAHYSNARASVGTLADIPADTVFDTILYMDVLEHIADDSRELQRAAEHLRPGGRLIVLAPAHQSLFTPFDSAIGHFRRYNRRTLRAAAPAALRLVSMRYLDAVGLLASLANRIALRQSMPSPRQIHTWDNFLVPISRRVDPLLGYAVGKSILAVWQA